MSQRIALPVDAILPEIRAALATHCNLVVEAEPGAGKTTRIPPALLAMTGGEVVVLEPRRIAARLAARRVASEMGEPVGETVGYQVRFEEAVSPRTRLRFVTEGVLTRRLLSDGDLKNVDAVVLDEFHERHLEGDLALALLLRLQQRRLQQKRPALRLIVMSATLEAAPIAEYLDNCPIVRSPGRLFELTVRHTPYSPRPVEELLCDAAGELLRASPTGDILAFLPGAAEIHRAMRQCAALARRANLLVLPLHGSLTPAEQDRALAPAAQRKLVLATNVAESSITVEGVTAVIDSGLARVAAYSPWSGLPVLQVARVSKASATQRAGRAARTAPGQVVRLYSEEDFLRRPEHDTPEILRSDLSQLCLDLRAMGLHAADVAWLDAPPATAVEQAEDLLDRLGAAGEKASRLARYPLPPRLARIVEESLARGVGEEGCRAAALLGAGVASTSSDLLAALDAPPDARLRQHTEQLRRVAGVRHKVHKPHKDTDDALLISVLAGFPDRVARLRVGKQVLMSSGASAEISGEPPRYEFFVAVDAEDRRERPLPLVRMTARVEPDWLLDLFAERVREETSIVWNHKGQRVEAVNSLLYDALVIDESRGAPRDAAAAAALLAEKALETGIDRFVDVDALNEFLARAAFALLDAPDAPGALRELCAGLRSFSELKTAAEDLLPSLERRLGAHKLHTLAPARIALPSGRQTKVHYETGKPPWIASRLQDFFGLKETPRIGPARTPVVAHLLAPNQRPVQTTADLAGFWERLYPQVRRELMRRYPRHAWPEKP
ncbi:MAG: ATP-dependent helicase HrpB [Acidobacteriota bacterium]|nr:ATP-dependent helicase HrpB [Acidobacteriota bacterium]